eukprot:XP_001692264.1 predicted protein [Chlamydomonas reinhardtii]
MVVHYFLKTAVPLNEPTGVTARLDASGEVQTLLTTTAGEFYPILGADNRAGLELGPSLQLFEASDSIEQPRRPFGGLSKWVGSPTWDAFSHSVFFIHGGAILRLVGDEVSLVAGDVEERGEQDGVGPDALFSGPEFLVSDGVGSLYCADERSIRRIILPACWAAAAPPYPAPSDALASATGVGSGSGADKRPSVAEAGIALLRVAPDGAVTTLARGLARMYARPFVLPNGYLVLSCQSDCQLLPADLGVLLEDAQQPGGGGTADLVIRVGERRFHCHRAILSARCDYFKQRLAGDGFADAYAAELELPDADADAFALLLRWLYTGAADVPSAQACAVAELADRLLLPELSTAAQAVALTCITPANAVDCLLWAWGCCDEGRGGSFAHLLADLKRWYVRHHEEELMAKMMQPHSTPPLQCCTTTPPVSSTARLFRAIYYGSCWESLARFMMHRLGRVVFAVLYPAQVETLLRTGVQVSAAADAFAVVVADVMLGKPTCQPF